MPTLSIVATPIGNLDDITLRAISVLRSADAIFCEDTRTTKKLLAHHAIETRTVSYPADDNPRARQKVIAFLKEGQDVALVSEAGTPAISDPGARIVSAVRDELPEVRIESIPGPSALTAALSIAGVPASSFLFLGFLPHKKGRQMLFQEIAASGRTAVFYESPHRMEKTLRSLSEVLHEQGEDEHNSRRVVTVAREITKLHESVISGNAAEVEEYFAEHPHELRGEFVVIISHKRGA